MGVRIDKAGGVWTVIHSRPEARNAVNAASAEALVAAFAAFDADRDASVAVLWGEGGAFCAGWDLKSVSGLDAEDPVGRLDFPKDGGTPPRGPLGPSRMQLKKPVLAAVEGPAVAGGMELALWCDVRVMAETAYFGVYCRRWGVPLIDGGTVRLPRLIGASRALDLVLTGRPVPAGEALQIGLANRVVPEGSAREAAVELAHQLARFPQTCMREDRLSLLESLGLDHAGAMANEFDHGLHSLADVQAGLERFRRGEGRHGAFEGPRRDH